METTIVVEGGCDNNGGEWCDDNSSKIGVITDGDNNG